MSSSAVVSLTFIGQQITIYGGFLILIAGVVGGLINTIVFLSLKTFRQSSCAFYLTIISIVNIGQLLLSVFSRIMIAGFGVDWTAMSLVYCKFRGASTAFCSLMSYICLCLATIDQYLATCTRPRWQQWSNIKIAHRLTIIFIIISCIFVIPYPIYFDQIILASGKISCTPSNDNMSQYRNYFVSLFLLGYLPDFITVLFGILAYHNVNQIAYRTVPLVRRELDKQLTVMVLVQVVINFLTNIPCVTMNAIMYGTSYIKDAVILERIQVIYTVTVVIFYSYFAVSKNY
jgi:hypothetical protein